MFFRIYSDRRRAAYLCCFLSSLSERIPLMTPGLLGRPWRGFARATCNKFFAIGKGVRKLAIFVTRQVDHRVDAAANLRKIKKLGLATARRLTRLNVR